MGQQHPNFKNNLLHELGHIVLFHYDDQVLQDYATIRRYPYAIDDKTQRALPPVDRVCEWFAEDFKFIFAYQDIGNNEYMANTTEPSAEVINIVKQLVYSPE
ncbi:MAG: hypothetical protein GXY49_14235 [Syntrophomonadaceae bacterium]|jgi:hypothetical protein|nr:hypothetical protein [Syntrophomonadaceae bacterium]